MAGSRTPGPLGPVVDTVSELATDIFLAPLTFLAGDWGCTTPETDRRKPKVGGCHIPPGPVGCTAQSTTNTRPIKALEVHIYMNIGRTAEEYFQWLTNADMQDDNRGQAFLQFNPTRHFDPSAGIKSFTDSLNKPGAIVLYIGHSDLGPTGNGPSRGLVPFSANHSENDPAQIPNQELRTLLSDAKASLVILASCDSVTAVGKLTSGPPVIVTDSGKKRVSQGGPMALAAAAFLFSLVGVALDGNRQPYNAFAGGHARIMQALAAANEMFASTHEGSAFVLAGGEDCTMLIP